MSCCNGNCGCGANCACGSGCKGCGRSDTLLLSKEKTLIFPASASVRPSYEAAMGFGVEDVCERHASSVCNRAFN